MQKTPRFFRTGALIAIATAALVSARFAKADDVTKTDDKSAKQDAASASKVTLSTPTSKLNFYGEAEAGVYASTFKCAGASKSQHATGEYYNLMLGTDIKLTSNITMGIQVQSGRGFTTFR